MRKFRKGYAIALIFMLITGLCPNPAYPKETLRLQPGNGDDTLPRIEETMKRLGKGTTPNVDEAVKKIYSISADITQDRPVKYDSLKDIRNNKKQVVKGIFESELSTQISKIQDLLRKEKLDWGKIKGYIGTLVLIIQRNILDELDEDREILNLIGLNPKYEAKDPEDKEIELDSNYWNSRIRREFNFITELDAPQKDNFINSMQKAIRIKGKDVLQKISELSEILGDIEKGLGSEQLQFARTILNDTKKPGVGYIEPVAAAYEAARLGRYDEAYDLVLEGLSGKDFVVNIETAIGVLRALVVHYGVDSDKGKALEGILEIVARRKRATDRLASWVRKKLQGGDLQQIIAELKSGKLEFENSFISWEGERGEHRNTEIRVNLASGIISRRSYGDTVEGGDSAYFLAPFDFTEPEEIGQEILELARAPEKLKADIARIRLTFLSRITSGSQLFMLGRFRKMTEEDIRRCLRSLAENVSSRASLKRAIVKKLITLQQKRPETIPIIQEKALELLVIDEENFIEAFKHVIGDHIEIMEARKEAGIKDETAPPLSFRKNELREQLKSIAPTNQL